MKILTPAKINPLLYILSKREDGFHELYMHMVPVSLFDTLTFTHNDGQGLNLKVSGAEFSEPPEENLVVRAVRIFELESGENVNLNVILEKHIPSGAGLGGGSGNADSAPKGSRILLWCVHRGCNSNPNLTIS